MGSLHAINEVLRRHTSFAARRGLQEFNDGGQQEFRDIAFLCFSLVFLRRLWGQL